jgi:hypothetical protein
MVEALKRFGPDVDLSRVKAAFKAHADALDKGSLDADKERAGIGLTKAETAAAYARANASAKGKPDQNAGFSAAADDLAQQAIDLARSGDINFGPIGAAADRSPVGMQGVDRQALNSIMEQFTLEIPKLMAKTTRPPARQELDVIRKTLLPSLHSSISREDMVKRLEQVQARLRSISDEEAAAAGRPPQKSLATTLVGPSPGLAPPAATPSTGRAADIRKRLERRGM